MLQWSDRSDLDIFYWICAMIGFTVVPSGQHVVVRDGSSCY